MSVITALFGSKIAVGLVAASFVTVGGTVAVTTAIADPPAATATSQATVEAGAGEAGATGAGDPTMTDTTPATPTEGGATDDTTDSTTESANGTSDDGASTGDESTNRQGSAHSAFGLCTAFVNGGLSTNSVAYTNLEKYATANGSNNANASGSVDPSAYCDAVIAVKKAAQNTADSATGGNDKSAEAKLNVSIRP